MLNQYLEEQLVNVNAEGRHAFNSNKENSSTPRTRLEYLKGCMR
ncbi:hypothetical protein FHS15_005592 [Paenibacillus castaneae]|nr:hypothetical protein [Paenibacillus castaneae]NIK80406.1 hypothetical protein [Paenibacillus castaneae]